MRKPAVLKTDQHQRENQTDAEPDPGDQDCLTVRSRTSRPGAEWVKIRSASVGEVAVSVAEEPARRLR